MSLFTASVIKIVSGLKEPDPVTGETGLSREKPGAGPGSYGTLLLIDR